MYIYTLLSALEKVQNPSRGFAASRSDVVQILYAYNTYSPVRPGRNGADRLVRHLRLLGRLSWSFCHEQWSNQSIQNVLLMYFITNVLLTNILHYSVRQKKKGHQSHEMARPQKNIPKVVPSRFLATCTSFRALLSVFWEDWTAFWGQWKWDGRSHTRGRRMLSLDWPLQNH